MDEEDLFDDPMAYVIAFVCLFGMYIVIILAIYAWRRLKPQRQATEDRQGNAFAAADDTSRENRFNDIFFIEPNSVEAARIRAQLEKDEKDLPSYDEVMRMTSLNSPTETPAAASYGAPVPAVPFTASSTSVNTTDTTLSVPAYSEVDLSDTSGPLTPPPYSPPTTTASIVLPITSPLHTQQSSSNV